MAYDVQRFNELTKQMSAMLTTRAVATGQPAAARLCWRDCARELAEQVNSQLQLRFLRRRWWAGRAAADCL